MPSKLSLSNIDNIVFNAFDPTSKKLLYTRYNFNFTKYKTDKGLPTSSDNLTVFKHFLDLNGSTWDKPYAVIDSLKQYFTPINDFITSYVNSYGNTTHKYYGGEVYNSSYFTQSELLKKQFDIANYSDVQVRLVQDFFIEDTQNKMKYTKWNFNFALYSNDFKIWGSKLLIFTDFIYRAINIANQDGILNDGYVMPETFKKYFINNPLLNDYIKFYGITSPYSFVYKNIGNVNWSKYAATVNVPLGQAKSHYYVTGQFEPVKMNFLYKPLTNYKSASNFIVDIFNNGHMCSGFLYRPFNDPTDKNIYVVTCYHILEDSDNLNTIRAILNIYNDNYNSLTPITLTAEFEVIGYDIYSDVLVARYNENIPFNVSNKVDLNVFADVFSNLSKLIDFNGIVAGKDVFTTTNMGVYANHSCYKGNIIDSKFTGFNNYIYTLTPPDSVIVNFDSQVGSSGSPIFMGNPDSTDVSELKFVGMINSYCQGLQNHTQCISFLNLYKIVNTIISKQKYFNTLTTNDFVLKNYISKYFYTYKWLGVYSSYFNVNISVESYPQLNNLSYTGGIVIGGFIIGFNYNTKEFVSNELELSELNVIKLDTPLLKTKMYRRFIESSKSPIVVKSISFYNNVKSEYRTYYLGKYGEQDSMSFITYDFGSCQTYAANSDTFKAKFGTSATLPDNLLFKYFSLYGLMDIEYYYYDSVKWVLEKETVGGNTADWFNTYKDTLGNTYFQHKFEYPHILTPYLTIYEDKEPCMKLYENKDFKNGTNAKSWWSRMRRRLRRAAQRARDALKKANETVGYGLEYMAEDFGEDQPIAYQILSTIGSMADTQQEERDGPNITDAFD